MLCFLLWTICFCAGEDRVGALIGPTQRATTRPTTVPSDWKPRYNGYVVAADTMVRVLGLSTEQYQMVRSRLLLMTYEMELWEQVEGRAAAELEVAFHRIDRLENPKAKLVAYFAWEAALAPKHNIRDGHLDWIDETVLTSEQRSQWQARELYLHAYGFVSANGFADEFSSHQARELASEVMQEIPGPYRQPHVYAARWRRLVDRIRTEVLKPEQSTSLGDLLKLRDEALAEYEATTQPVRQTEGAPK